MKDRKISFENYMDGYYNPNSEYKSFVNGNIAREVGNHNEKLIQNVFTKKLIKIPETKSEKTPDYISEDNTIMVEIHSKNNPIYSSKNFNFNYKTYDSFKKDILNSIKHAKEKDIEKFSIEFKVTLTYMAACIFSSPIIPDEEIILGIFDELNENLFLSMNNLDGLIIINHHTSMRSDQYYVLLNKKSNVDRSVFNKECNIYP